MKTNTLPSRLSAWIVYILRCSDGSYYTGATNCLEDRLARHNRGTASKYTRCRRPVTLLAASDPMTRSEALRLEARIKKMHRHLKPDSLKAYRRDEPQGQASASDKIHED